MKNSIADLERLVQKRVDYAGTGNQDHMFAVAHQEKINQITLRVLQKVQEALDGIRVDSPDIKR